MRGPREGGDEVRHRVVGAVVDDDQVVHRPALAGQGVQQDAEEARRRQVTTIATTDPGATPRRRHRRAPVDTEDGTTGGRYRHLILGRYAALARLEQPAPITATRTGLPVASTRLESSVNLTMRRRELKRPARRVVKARSPAATRSGGRVGVSGRGPVGT